MRWTRSWSFTRQGWLATAGLLAIGVATLQGLGNAAWLYTLLLLAAGFASVAWNRRLQRLTVRLAPVATASGPVHQVAVTIDGLPRVWLAAVVVRADGREERGPATAVAQPGGLVTLPPPRPGDRSLRALEATDRWPWGWFHRRRRWVCDLSLAPAAAPATATSDGADVVGLRTWHPSDGPHRLVWRRLHRGLFARDLAEDHDAGRPRPRPTPRLAEDGAAPVVPPPAPDERTIAALLLACGIGTLGLASILPLPVVLAAVPLGLWRWWRARRHQGAVGPLVRWSLLAALGGLLVVSGGLHPGLDGAVPAFFTLLWIKALELDRDREVHLMATLALFACGTVLLADGGLAMFLVALTGAALAGLALAHHHGGPQTIGPVLVAAPAAVLAFLLLPRSGLGMAPLEGADRGAARSGLSAILNPSGIAQNLEDPTPVFRAEGIAATEAIDGWYWRGHVLWDPDARGDAWRPGIEPFRERPRLTGDQTTRVVRLTLLPEASLPPAPEMTAAAPKGQFTAFAGVLRWKSATDKVPVYDVEVQPNARDGGLSETSLRRSLLLPENLDPRVAALGQSLARQDPVATAAALVQWLSANGFAYTTEPGTQDGIAGFLLEGRRGFCAHYAAAGALVLRAAGVPTRIVVGWRGGEWNDLGGYLLVRQRHAHAWNEFWDGDAWRRLDLVDGVPTINPLTGRADGPPRTSAESGTKDRWWRPLTQIPDYLAARWDQIVLGYDQQRRQALLSAVGGGAGLLALLALATAGGVGLYRWRHRPPPTQRAYRDYLRALERLGLGRQPDEGPGIMPAGRRRPDRTWPPASSPAMRPTCG